MNSDPCTCSAPDWYHDGLYADCDGRLCRKCRRREDTPYPDLPCKECGVIRRSHPHKDHGSDHWFAGKPTSVDQDAFPDYSIVEQE